MQTCGLPIMGMGLSTPTGTIKLTHKQTHTYHAGTGTGMAKNTHRLPVQSTSCDQPSQCSVWTPQHFATFYYIFWSLLGYTWLALLWYLHYMFFSCSGQLHSDRCMPILLVVFKFLPQPLGAYVSDCLFASPEYYLVELVLLWQMSIRAPPSEFAGSLLLICLWQDPDQATRKSKSEC